MKIHNIKLKTQYDNGIFYKTYYHRIEVAFYEYKLYVNKKPFLSVGNQHLNTSGVIKLLTDNKKQLQDFLKINEISEIE